jgi:Rieske Fe-S protein
VPAPRITARSFNRIKWTAYTIMKVDRLCQHCGHYATWRRSTEAQPSTGAAATTVLYCTAHGQDQYEIDCAKP